MILFVSQNFKGISRLGKTLNKVRNFKVKPLFLISKIISVLIIGVIFFFNLKSGQKENNNLLEI